MGPGKCSFQPPFWRPLIFSDNKDRKQVSIYEG